MDRASTAGVGGRGFDPGAGGGGGERHKVKIVPVATLLGSQHSKASTGFSSPKNICNITYITCVAKIGKKVCQNKKGPIILNV